MYRVDRSKYDGFEAYILTDETSGSRVTVVPERGGIIAGFEVNGRETLYMDHDTFIDPLKNIRGGIPVLFPICGSLENSRYEYGGNEYKMGNHGFARNHPWKIEDILTEDGAGIIISLKYNDETYEKYPFEFEIVYEYILKGNRITVNQKYKNCSSKPMPVYAGFHPYFNVSDRNALKYEIDADTLWDTREKRTFEYNGVIEFPEEDTSKIILYPKGGSLWFLDEKLGRKISMEYSSDFKYIVIWSVAGKEFVCVEPWMSMPDAMNTGRDLRILRSEETMKAHFSITCSQI